MKELPELTEDQKDIVRGNFDKMKLPQLTQLVFNDPLLDGRSYEGKAVKKYCIDNNLGVETTVYRPKSDDFVLTEEQKQYIRNHARNTQSYEMARVLFNDQTITHLDVESRAIEKYVITLPKTISQRNFEDVGEYEPPRTFIQICKCVNRYVMHVSYNPEALNSLEKKNLQSVINAMNSPRYLQMMNSYTDPTSRRIFEGEFVRNIFDKPDLTTDELNLSVNLCWNYVQMITLNNHLSKLNERYDNVLDDPESKLSQNLSEMIKAKTTELKECDSRQQSIIKQLNGTRAERNKNKTKLAFTFTTLIEAWKEDTERKSMIKRAQARNQELEDEFNRLESLEEWKCRLAGLSKDELLRG